MPSIVGHLRAIKYGESRPSAVSHGHSLPPELARVGALIANFQAGHASSIPLLYDRPLSLRDLGL